MKKVVFIQDKFKSKLSKITDITHLICEVNVCYTVHGTEVLSAFLWDVKVCRNADEISLPMIKITVMIIL